MRRADEQTEAPSPPPAVSASQRRFWFLDQITSGVPVYNSYSAIRLTGPLDPAVAVRALREVVGRHRVLRSSFPAEDGQPVLATSTADCAAVVPFVDLSAVPGQPRGAAADDLVDRLAHRTFDIHRGPLFRAAVIRTGNDRHTVLIGVHHIVSDGWSVHVVFRDFRDLYATIAAGVEIAPEQPRQQFSDIVARQEKWRTSAEHDRQLDYWRGQLDGVADESCLPPDRRTSGAGGHAAGHASYPVAGDLSARIRALARAERVTIFMVLLTGLKITLSRYLERGDVTVGTPIALRDDPDVQNMVGPLLNTLALRTDLSGAPTVRQSLARVRDTCLAAYDNQEIPFDTVVAALGGTRDLESSPFFRIMFQYVTGTGQGHTFAGLLATLTEVEIGLAKLDLTLDAVETPGGGLDLVARYRTSRYDRTTIDRLSDHWQAVLAAMCQRPDASIDDLDLLTAAERAVVAAASTGPSVVAPDATSVLDLIERMVEADPDAEAVVCGPVRLSYGQLDRRANQLAHRLGQFGVVPETRVAILMERSAETIVAVLAVWKAGGAYVPIDIDMPAARREVILDDAGVTVQLTQEQLAGDLAGDRRRVLVVEPDHAGYGHLPTSRPARTTTSGHLSYVIYTSGSTGRPKGVMTTNAGLLSTCTAWEHAFGLKGRIRSHLQMANFCFDGFLGELVRTLTSGAKLVICPREFLLSPDRLLALVRNEQVEVADFVPPVLRALAGHLRASGQDLGGLRLVIVGSDTVSTDELAGIRRLGGPDTQVVNCYGLTEGTVDSTYFVCPPDWPGDASVLIGEPLPGMTAYLLDPALRPVPPGTPGTIFIAGPTVARGYLGDPGRTAAAFLPDPFSTRPGARMYRTGDRGRWRTTPQGLRIEYLGRADQQVKIRAYRVELGEIEAALRRLPGVRDAVAVVDDGDTTDRRIHAYVAAADDVETGGWHPTLRATLPHYMLPDRLVVLPALPTTATGKTDRRALTSRPGREITLSNAGTAPRTATERRLARLWTRVLHDRPVGVHDDFFVTGGDSLLAMRLLARVRAEWGTGYGLRQFFRGPTIAQVAARIDAEGERTERDVDRLDEIVPAAREFIDHQAGGTP